MHLCTDFAVFVQEFFVNVATHTVVESLKNLQFCVVGTIVSCVYHFEIALLGQVLILFVFVVFEIVFGLPDRQVHPMLLFCVL